jgi:hypothetical protein
MRVKKFCRVLSSQSATKFFYPGLRRAISYSFFLPRERFGYFEIIDDGEDARSLDLPSHSLGTALGMTVLSKVK